MITGVTLRVRAGRHAGQSVVVTAQVRAAMWAALNKSNLEQYVAPPPPVPRHSNPACVLIRRHLLVHRSPFTASRVPFAVRRSPFTVRLPPCHHV